MTRNANGESNIYQDARGHWHGQVSMGHRDDGVRDRRHVSGATRAEVVVKVRELEAHRSGGTVDAAGKAPTLATWLTHWLTNSAARRVRVSTLARYAGLIDNQIIPGLGHHRLDKLTPEHVEKFYTGLLDGTATNARRPLSPATVHQVHRVLSRALKVAMQRGKVTRNVCTLVDSPSVERDEVEPLTAGEAQRVLRAAEGARNAARWSVALALGLRQGEALGLSWQNLDLDAGTLSVRQALQRQKGKGLVIVRPKSRAGTRTIALPDHLCDGLRRHRTAQRVERMAAGSRWSNDLDLVFVQIDGKPIDPRADHAMWRAVLAQAGVAGTKLHNARHTAATLLLVQGVPARVVMEMLGHSQISLTLGTYSHVSPELSKDAARRMNDALWG